MFGYLKFFAVASLAAVVIIAVLIGMYFRAQVGADLIALAEESSVNLVRGFDEGVWSRYRGDLEKGTTTKDFDNDANRFVKNAGLVGFRVYNPGGIVLYTTGGTLPAQEFSREVSAVKQDEGHAISKVSSRLEAGVGADQPQQMVMRTFAPVGKGDAAGYVEVYRDIDKTWKRLGVLQYVASGSVIIVFLLLIWVLILVSKKAETIIARQHEANMELAAAAASAQAENREKSLFLANISHELRTPLNAIIGFSDIIRSELLGEVKNQKYHDYVSDIHSSGVHLLSLINDILDFSKAEAGKLELEIEEVNASKMIENCLRLVSPRAEAGGIELINAMPREAIALETDSKKLKQIMLNLLSNAVKFTPSGGRVRVTAFAGDNGMVSFEINDTGIGIAAKDIAKALSPFGQVDSALSRKYEGTGLGLPLTKKFIELMGGQFNIQSELNVGTTIIFSLPRAFSARDDVFVRRIA